MWTLKQLISLGLLFWAKSGFTSCVKKHLNRLLSGKVLNHIPVDFCGIEELELKVSKTWSQHIGIFQKLTTRQILPDPPGLVNRMFLLCCFVFWKNLPVSASPGHSSFTAVAKVTSSCFIILSAEV